MSVEEEVNLHEVNVLVEDIGKESVEDGEEMPLVNARDSEDGVEMEEANVRHSGAQRNGGNYGSPAAQEIGDSAALANQFNVIHLAGAVEEGYVCEDETNALYTTPDGKRVSLDFQEIAPPAVGMVFPTWDDVDSYYRSYGKQEGFGVVRAASAYRQVGGRTTNIKRNSTWKCDCHGKYVVRRYENSRNTCVGKRGLQLGVSKSKKCECPAMLYAAVEMGEWHIKKVVLEHRNHKPTPTKAKYISMYRQDELTNAVRRRLFNDAAAGVKVPQILRGLARERNGLENMGLNERDLRNVLNKDRRLKLEGGDAKAMYSYFKRMSADNQNFFHMHRLDEHERLKDVLWVDARSRAAYLEFSDVVCFDSTYITNKFHLPFANFVGVNHHGQSILLGCALVSREDCETFEWVFSTWLDCMGGKAPIGILTDQDAAIRKALKNVMPESRHRWCLWHILNKFSKRLGARANYKEIKEALHNSIYDSITEDEFCESWKAVLTKYGLENDDWLNGLYEERLMWVPTYLKHMFWAGMKTTQRSESVNSFFDGYVHKETRLYEFAQQYFNAMESRAKAEAAADADCSRYTQHLVTDFALEKVFQKCYTHGKFIEVQTECAKKYYLHPVESKGLEAIFFPESDLNDDEIEFFTLEDRIWVFCNKRRKQIVMKRRKCYIVKFNKKTGEAWCACKHFESHGIVCRHIIYIPGMRNIEFVPEMFILDRWRKDKQRRHTRVKVAYHDPSKTEEVMRYDRLMVSFESLCLTASTDKEDEKLVVDMISETTKRIIERRSEAQKNGANVVASPFSPTSSAPPDAKRNCTTKRNKEAATPNTLKRASDQFVPPPATPNPSGPPDDTTQPSPSCVIKDPISRKRAHRTTDKRFLSCIEKPRTRSCKKKQSTKEKDDKLTKVPNPTTPARGPVCPNIHSSSPPPTFPSPFPYPQYGVHMPYPPPPSPFSTHPIFIPNYPPATVVYPPIYPPHPFVMNSATPLGPNTLSMAPQIPWNARQSANSGDNQLD